MIFVALLLTPAFAAAAAEPTSESSYADGVALLQRGEIQQANAKLTDLLRSRTKAIPLHQAAADGNLDAVKEELAHGWPIDYRTEKSQTSLHLAVH